MTLFSQDFYPTPPEVAATMLDPLDLRGRTVLEPSAGNGNLVHACLERGAEEVLWCEPEPQLRAIRQLWGHGGMILGNPPFTATGPSL
jgi:predicted RNA methylase